MAIRHYTLTLNGSAQRLSSVLTADVTPGGTRDESIREIVFSPDPANTNAVYVGASGVTSADHGFSLDPTQASQIPVSLGPFDAGVFKLSELYAIGTNAEKLHFLVIPY